MNSTFCQNKLCAGYWFFGGGMTLRFLSAALLVGLIAFRGDLSAGGWLDMQQEDIPWAQVVIVNNGLSGPRLRLQKALTTGKCSRQMLCDIGLHCMQAIMANPSCWLAAVPGYSVTYDRVLSAVHNSLHDKTGDKETDVALIRALVQDFSHLMAVDSNHSVIRGTVEGAGSRREVIALLQSHLNSKKDSGNETVSGPTVVYRDPYAQGQDIQGPVGFRGNVLDESRLAPRIGNSIQHVNTQRADPLPLPTPSYPGPCSACQQLPVEPAAAGGVTSTQSPQGAKKIGPYAAATVLGVALAGLLIDCAVRKKRSWLVRAMQATGRGLRSLARWLKISGRPSQTP